MKATIKTFQCKNGKYFGDCIFLILKNEITNESFHMMIDCGALSEDIKGFIRNDLEMRLDMVIATHIDSDHIDGITAILNDPDLKNLTIGKILFNCYQPAEVELAETELEEAESQETLPVKSERHDSLSEGIKKRLNSLVSSYPMPFQDKISASTAVSLASRIVSDDRLKRIWHDVLITNESDDYLLGGNWGKLIFLSPTILALRELEDFFKSKFASFTGIKFPENPFENIVLTYELLLKIEEKKKRHFKGKWIGSKYRITEAEMESMSKLPVNENSLSYPNKASLAFIWEVEGHRILFLGDAMASTVLSSLERKYPGQPLQFDAIKVSHHGSKYNTTGDLMDKIDAPVFYLTGGDSSSEDCPTLDAIAKIVTGNIKNDRKISIRFNFSNDIINRLIFPESEGLRNKYKFELIDDTKEAPYEFQY